MIVVTTEKIAGKKIKESLGLVRGSTIRAKHIGKDIVAGFRTIGGGEIKEYTQMMTEAREQAISRMVEDATRLGADAVVCMRFDTAQVLNGSAECIAYGTAVLLQDE